MLHAKNLSYEYASNTSLAHVALRDVSLSLEEGGSLLIVGSTGSGKSTLLRVLAGLLDPATGSVLVNDKPVRPASVGLVFQQPESQLFSETVISDVAFGPSNLGASKEEAARLAREALLEVGLDPDEYGERSPFTLSGGQARRVAIAGVLAMDLPYVLFDEPTAGLDGVGRRFFRDLVGKLQGQGKGIIVVSHDVDEFLDIVDDTLLLRDGSVVWSGKTSALVASPVLFSKAGLAMPDLLRFQCELACADGGYVLDVDKVAHWALAGYSVGGPGGHGHHDHDARSVSDADDATTAKSSPGGEGE